MKALIFCLLAISSLCVTAQNFVRVNTAPTNEVGDVSWACSWGDYDNDGHMDLYVANYFDKNFLYHNNGNKTFTKITTGALVTSESIGHWSSTWVDFDDDGDLDMYVVNSYTDNNELLRNNGNGTFTNISSVITNTGATNDNNAAWADTDNDGDLDLFLANGSNSTPATRDEDDSFFINNGNGTFTQNITSPIATDGGFSQYATFGDYDDDNDLDLLVVNTFGVNFFYENKGNNVFQRITGLPFLSTGEQPVTAVWGDFNNDNYQDLVIGSYTDSRIYYNNGNKTFHVGTFPTLTGNAAGVSTGDFNNDTFLDVLFVRSSQTPLLYINNGNETFTKTNAGDLTLTTCDFTYSGAIADYDNDGDLDVFINNDNSGNLLFENTEVTGNWLAVKLVGTSSNSQGIGAKVRVRTDGVWQAREVSVLSSYRTQNSVLAHFGLGGYDHADVVRIEWPSGNIQILKDIAAGQLLTITEANTPANDHHVMATITAECDEDSEMSFHPADFTAAFFDQDGDKLKKIAFPTKPEDGTLFYDGVEMTGTPEIALADIVKLKFKPNQDFNGNRFLEYTAIDNRSLGQEGIIAAWIEPVNDPPTITAIADIEAFVMNPGEMIGIHFNVFDIDSDEDGLEISIDSDDTDYAPPGNFELSVDDNNLRLYSFQVVRGGSTAVTVTVSDGDGQAHSTFNLMINMAHLLDVHFEVREDHELHFATTDFTDNFVDDDDDLLQSIKLTSLPRRGVLKFNSVPVSVGDVIATEDIDGLMYVPEPDFFGLDDITYDALDTRGYARNFTSEITVTNVNDAPYITNQIEYNHPARPGQTIEVQIQFDDGDSPVENMTMSAIADNPTVAPQSDMSFTGTGGNRTFRLKAREPGQSKIYLEIQDLDIIIREEINVVVIQNTPLQMNAHFFVPEDFVLEFLATDFTDNAGDGEGDKLASIKITALPGHGIMTWGTKNLAVGDVLTVADLPDMKYTPAKDFYGKDYFEYDAIDELDLAGPASSEINVTPSNDAPEISDVADKTITRLVNEDIVTAEVQVTDVDHDPVLLTFNATADNAEVLFDPNVSVTGTGTTKTLHMKVVKGGTTVITMTAADGELATTKTFKLTVLSVVSGLEESLEEIIAVYPNPVTDRMNIDIGSIGSDVRFEVIDGVGKVLKKGSVSKESVDVHDLSAGIYLLRCIVGENVLVKKVIKK